VKALLFFVVISLFYTVNFKESLIGIGVLLSTIAIIILVRDTMSLNEVFKLIQIACSIIILTSFCFYLFGISSSYDLLQGKERFSGITYGAHPLASICVFYILITIVNYRLKLSRWFILNSSMLLIALLLIKEADSRQAVIGLLIAIIVMIWYKINFLSKIFLCSLSIMTIMLVSQEIEKDKFLESQSRTSSSEEISTLTGRTAIWVKSIELIKKNPILGNGYNAGQFELENNYQTMHGWSTRSAHNFLLHQGLDLGILGIILLIFGLISTLKVSSQSKSKVTLSILLYCFVISLVERGFAGGVNIYSFIFLIINLYIPNINNYHFQGPNGKQLH
jgi:O-antigen ligase